MNQSYDDDESIMKIYNEAGISRNVGPNALGNANISI